MALGADRGRVLRMVMRQTLIWLGAGTVIGIGLAIASGRLLQAFLFEVKRTDPRVIALAPLVLVASGVLAAMVPAKKASAIDPAEALRGEWVRGADTRLTRDAGFSCAITSVVSRLTSANNSYDPRMQFHHLRISFLPSRIPITGSS
jgi:predicted lysophospholipase L1 biosynthesis ABC-type transport system permease subunit